MTRDKWKQIGIPEGWEIGGLKGEYIQRNLHKIWHEGESDTFLVSDQWGWLPGVYHSVEEAMNELSL